MAEPFAESYLSKSLRASRVSPSCFEATPVRGADHYAFGGQIAAQALFAASGMLDQARFPNSHRTTFIAAAAPDAAVRHEMAWLKQGRAFSMLQVASSQAGKLCMTSLASFHSLETSPEHQAKMPDVPVPADCDACDFVPPNTNPDVRSCFEIREVADFQNDHLGGHPGQAYWLRSLSPLPDDHAMHCAALVWFSDLSMPWTTELPYKGLDLQRVGASLDHSVWFHRPFRADDWLLFIQESLVYAGARAFTRGSFFDRDGRIVATASQETLLRRLPFPQPDKAS